MKRSTAMYDIKAAAAASLLPAVRDPPAGAPLSRTSPANQCGIYGAYVTDLSSDEEVQLVKSCSREWEKTK